jgi:hypothetical protein
MTMDEFMSAILAIAPEALFDEEHGSGEIMISTGLRLQYNNLIPIDAMVVSGE